ncbi:MAG: FHA domain-containing protein [Spirulina sp.]
MKDRDPSLHLRGPDGELSTLKLLPLLSNTKTRLSIGRESDNDIVLPNPYRKVSKYHCAIACENNSWLAIDTDSANGTFVQRKNELIDVARQENHALTLQDGDEILILGKWNEPDDYVYWHLTFWMSDITQEVPMPFKQWFEYSLSQEQLFRVSQFNTQSVKLSPNQRKLIHHMGQRMVENDGKPVVCGHKELIEAVWSEKYGHTEAEITRLIWGIRQKIEVDSGEPSYLKTVKGRGYLLDIEICQ